MEETRPTVHNVDVTSAFFYPHTLLQRYAQDDSLEVRKTKLRQNTRWLKRWLPTYIVRWFCIFLVSSLAWSVVDADQTPVILQCILVGVQTFSGVTAAWLGFTYAGLNLDR